MIKKSKNRNQYKKTPEGFWVRNPFIENTPFIDINKTISDSDYPIFLENEFHNTVSKYPWIDSENISHKNLLIISDGVGYKNGIMPLLENLPKDVTVVGTNGVLRNWVKNFPIHYYVVNNPYQECLGFLPKNGPWPKCIASSRTNYKFLKSYRGNKFRYQPVPEKTFSCGTIKESPYFIDDYRNPICAAINIFSKMNVEKILLCFVMDGYLENKPGTIKIENIYSYSQQILANNIVNECLYWIKERKISIGNLSLLHELKNAKYITTENIKEFFESETG